MSAHFVCVSKLFYYLCRKIGFFFSSSFTHVSLFAMIVMFLSVVMHCMNFLLWYKLLLSNTMWNVCCVFFLSLSLSHEKCFHGYGHSTYLTILFGCNGHSVAQKHLRNLCVTENCIRTGKSIAWEGRTLFIHIKHFWTELIVCLNSTVSSVDPRSPSECMYLPSLEPFWLGHFSLYEQYLFKYLVRKEENCEKNFLHQQTFDGLSFCNKVTRNEMCINFVWAHKIIYEHRCLKSRKLLFGFSILDTQKKEYTKKRIHKHKYKYVHFKIAF